jgi:hypothetical protein
LDRVFDLRRPQKLIDEYTRSEDRGVRRKKFAELKAESHRTQKGTPTREGRRIVFVFAEPRGVAPGYFIARLRRFDSTRASARGF